MKPFIIIFHPDSIERSRSVDFENAQQVERLFDLLQTNQHIFKSSKKKYKEYLFLYHNEGFVKIKVTDIQYLTASRTYSVVHTANHRDYMLSVPTSQIVPFLPETYFVRVNRSAVINLNYIDGLQGNTVIMADNEKFTVSRQYRTHLFNHFQFVGTKSKKYGDRSENPPDDSGKHISP